MSSLVMTDADCDVMTPAGACTVPSGDGPYRGTFIVTSSVPLTATRNIIVPLSPGRAVFVKNTSSGAQQICVKGSTGSAACIASGQTGIAVSDGANYNLISGGGSSGTSSLGLVVADGATYTTIQAAYTAACAASPNLDVYVPANSTVTDTLSTSVNYLISTCTSQLTDGRSGATFGSARANVLFQPRYERIEYHPKEAEMKLKMIELARNGANLANMGIPAVPQWIVMSAGDSVNQFANQMTILQRSLGVGVSGVVTTAAHAGTQNNNQYYGLTQDAFGLNSVRSGTTVISPNGTPDPTSPNGSSLTIGSSSATGQLDVYMVATTLGSDTTYRPMPQFKLFYLCDGHGAFNISYSPDNQNYFSEPVTWTQPSSCATTGSIVAIGVAGTGSGTCTADITLGASGGGGSGFSGIGHINSSGGVSWVEVTSGGSSYDPYTTTIARTGGGTCSVNPTFSNILTSNMSIQAVTLQHDGLGRIRITNQSGSSVKVFAWEEYDPNTAGVVYEDLGFGGSGLNDDFAAPSSYLNGFYQAIPAPDTVLIEYLDNPQMAGHPINYWVQQWNTRGINLQSNKVSSISTQSACEAAGNWWNTTSSVCNAYTPDIEWISSYTNGFITDPSAGRDVDRDAMNAIEQINRGGGNAYYVDINYPNSSGQEFANRRAFTSTDSVHVDGAGQAYLNGLFQANRGIPSQDLFESRAQTTIHVGQGAATRPGLGFLRSGGHGLYVDSASANRFLVSAGTFGVDGVLFSRATTIGALTSYVPNPGSTSATYAICAGNNFNLNPFGCSPDFTVTNGPTTLSSSNYIQVCLPNTIPGATSMALIRKSGYTGASVVQQTQSFSNATTPTCMYDIGQSGTGYSAAAWIPTGNIRVNGPTGLLDPLQVFAARVFDGGTGTYSDAYLERGSIFGTSHGVQWKILDNGSIANYCTLNIGASTSWGFQAGCAGTFANAQFSFLQPVNLQPFSFTNSTIRIQSSSSNYTGTIGAFEFRSSAVNAAPSGGALIHINSDSGYGGYLALLRGANTAVFGVKQASIEFFNNTSNPITGVQGLGSNLLTTGGAVPTMVAGAAAGTSPACTTITGGNTAGVITCTTGAGTTTGTLATITFSGTLTLTPNGCHLQARDATTAPMASSIYTTAPSTTTWTIGVASALAASTTYTWAYSCL
ncbi:hypothetical protein [Terriglobus albidus]|uniref:hypothetical protein n=1 Tax=Terriglobus albidus TaxID=1592106 RepID=UPI0021E09613|nr:hypothetical protein [Terriglobus albidus]